MNIKHLNELAGILNHGPYVWPGGYPKFFMMQDGEACCFECVKDNRIEVFAAAPGCLDCVPRRDTQARSPDPQWWPVAVEINWEDPSMYCAHCNGPIESAYVPHETEEVA